MGGTSMEERKVTGDSWGKKVRSQFVAGLLIVVPVAASVLILVWLFNSIDHILAPIVRTIFGHNIPGVGFGATVILIYVAGIVATNIIGRRILTFGESLISRVPVFRYLYAGIRQIMESFAAPDKTGFMQVVLVEFPRPGLKSLGFVTNQYNNSKGEKVLSILIPTAPNPTSGFLEIVSEKDVIRTSLSVDDALKMVVSAGRITPDEVRANVQDL
jgi:uncharacterized membrane protein